VVVAVALVRVVQVILDQVIHVIAVRHGLMSTIRPVDMAHLMPSTQMTRRALHGVGTADFNPVLIDSIPSHVL